MPIRVAHAKDDQSPPPAGDPVPLTPEEHAQACWSWLEANCAPSTWTAFTHSIAVRQPQVKGWTA